MQEGKVVAYASRQLKLHEKNYLTPDLELAAIVFPLKIWRHYLYGEKCRIFTGHKSLKYLMDQKNLNLQQRRWLELLKDYELVIDYHPGKVNVVANALSRKSPYALRAMSTSLELSKDGVVLAELRARLLFIQQICEAEKNDNEMQAKRTKCEWGNGSDFRVVKLHGVPVSIISDRDLRFTSRFWKKLQEALRTRLNFSTSFHAQTDGHSERVIQVLEDMFRCCVLEFKARWERYLPLVEFAYNNSYQSMFPWKKILRFGQKGKLSPRFIGSYEISERIGPMAYRLALQVELEKIHNVFHVSMLKRYRSDPSHVIPPTEIEIQSDMSYEEEPINIMAREVKQLSNKRIALVKVLW
ncbi:integrase [Gossypium australe]|uniref:Integrase n=1 Tax=Gossypium australe TaxID=47621 RepID=A0A5B6VFJ1_9ROSI|nr:integrase [Gossypium australe]